MECLFPLLPTELTLRAAHASQAIVRTLKRAGRMGHAELVKELRVSLAPRLVPEPSLVRRCVEYLMDKEYVTRSESDREVYVYVP